MNNMDAFAEIENSDFALRLAIGSDFNSVIRIARYEPAVEYLSDSLSGTGVSLSAAMILNRIIVLSSYEVDRRFENPWDLALTVYLWMLQLHRRIEARTGSEATLKAPNCWWAAKLSRHILLSETRWNEATHLPYELSQLTSSIDQTTDSDNLNLVTGFLGEKMMIVVIPATASAEQNAPYEESNHFHWSLSDVRPIYDSNSNPADELIEGVINHD